MNLVILRTAAGYLLPLLLLFSVFILLRGHYLPGGGFVGGLVASIAFVLHAFAHGFEKSTRGNIYMEYIWNSCSRYSNILLYTKVTLP